MLINFTGKNVQVTEDMRQMAENQLGKLDKYFNEEVRCNVTFSEFKENSVVEITINLPGSFIRSEVSDPDLRTALDRATDRLARQIRKHKTRLKKKYQGKETIRIDNIPDWPVQDDSSDSNKIIKTKTFSTRPMSEDEAILQLELVGHNFYVFNNSESNQINVLYKRKNGGYGLLIPSE